MYQLDTSNIILVLPFTKIMTTDSKIMVNTLHTEFLKWIILALILGTVLYQFLGFKMKI
jgi:hypothetical protein